jgi:hypothetical protein
MTPPAICQRSGLGSFDNATELDTARLQGMCLEAVAGWSLHDATVLVRYSRGADFSGSCCYQTGKILVNLGRHLTYPYRIGTHLARARAEVGYWWKPIYTVELSDAYRVVLFVFLHECFHLLVKRARRNVRQKESMCDRFAARCLVDLHGAVVRDECSRPVPRSQWDFQDLDGFVAAARRGSRTRRSDRARTRRGTPTPRLPPAQPYNQLLLFDL